MSCVVRPATFGRHCECYLQCAASQSCHDTYSQYSNRHDHPYFPFFPKPGSISCLQNATCSIPIYASPGIPSHVISSIDIVPANTQVPGIQTSSVEPVTYRGVHTFRADIHFSTSTLGNLTACFVAKDNHGLTTEQCVDVSSYPRDPCETMLCHASAECVPNGLDFACLCPPEKTGRLCEIYVDPCLSRPCQNGGTCLSIPGRYEVGPVCKCASGFSGTTDCATNIDDCASSPCQHGATCVDLVNGYLCNCTNGYTDATCSSHIDDCTSSPCQNGGVCVDHVNGYHCNCINGYAGATCSTLVDPCSSNPCLNGGTCFSHSHSDMHICVCPGGYSGVNCGTNIDDCASSPCQNGGVCVDHVNGYHCNCINGYAGATCSTWVDPCSSNPCLNGGTCFSHSYSDMHICVCPGGYSGVNCGTNTGD